MKILTLDSAEWQDLATRGLAREIINSELERAAFDAAEQLPTISTYLTITVRPHNSYLIPEYGTGGYTHDADFIEITFDKTVPHGPEALLAALRSTVLHEVNHAARYNSVEFDGRFLHSIIMEGLATVFEREYGNNQPLYGQYESNEVMVQWLEEIRGKDWADRNDVMFDHPDGRKWIGYKTGTWLVDKAIENSGKSVTELTILPADDIIALAHV